MADEQLYCDAPDCRDPENPDFPRPVAGHGKGKCSSHMKQLQRTGKTTAIAEKKSAKERLIDLGDAWLNETEDEVRANDLLRRFIAAAKGMPDPNGDVQAIVDKAIADKEAQARQRRTAATLKAHQRARAEGKRIGRPPKTAPRDLGELVAGVYAETGSVSATARALGLDPKTVRARLGKKSTVTPQPRLADDGPRRAG